MWKKNIVKVNGQVVYKLLKGISSSNPGHAYSDEGLAVKDVVEEHVKKWISQKILSIKLFLEVSTSNNTVINLPK